MKTLTTSEIAKEIAEHCDEAKRLVRKYESIRTRLQELLEDAEENQEDLETVEANLNALYENIHYTEYQK